MKITVLMTASLRKEVALTLVRCDEKRLLEGHVISTNHLTRELNSNEFRSKEWDPFEVSIAMTDLGFEMAVTPVTNFRGWKVEREKVLSLLQQDN